MTFGFLLRPKLFRCEQGAWNCTRTSISKQLLVSSMGGPPSAGEMSLISTLCSFRPPVGINMQTAFATPRASPLPLCIRIEHADVSDSMLLVMPDEGRARKVRDQRLSDLIAMASMNLMDRTRKLPLWFQENEGGAADFGAQLSGERYLVNSE